MEMKNYLPRNVYDLIETERRKEIREDILSLLLTERGEANKNENKKHRTEKQDTMKSINKLEFLDIYKKRTSARK